MQELDYVIIKRYSKLSRDSFLKRMRRKFKEFKYLKLFSDDIGSGWQGLVWLLGRELKRARKSSKQYKTPYSLICNGETVIESKIRFLVLFFYHLSKLYSVENTGWSDKSFYITKIGIRLGKLHFEFDNSCEYIDKILEKYIVYSEFVCSRCGSITQYSNLKGDANVFNFCDYCWYELNKNKKFGVLAYDEEKGNQRVY